MTKHKDRGESQKANAKITDQKNALAGGIKQQTKQEKWKSPDTSAIQSKPERDSS
jgi:hypothetical protein